MDGADRARQLLHIDILQQVAVRAGLDGTNHQLGLGKRRERDNPYRGLITFDQRDRRHAVHLGHHQVHQHDVRAQRGRQVHRLTPAARLAHQIHVRRDADDRAQPLADDGVVVHNHQANCLHVSLLQDDKMTR